MPEKLTDQILDMTRDKTKAELINLIEKQQIIINQLRSIDDPCSVEEQHAVGVCPSCSKHTDQVESPYRCRHCGKALIWG